MNTYLAIITTALVVTQVIRLVQNTIQLRKQDILFKEQLGQIRDVTPEDFDTQRKAYRLIVEHFEEKKFKPHILAEEKYDIVNLTAETEIWDGYTPERAMEDLRKEFGKKVIEYATIAHYKNPVECKTLYKAEVKIADKRNAYGQA